MVEERVGGSVRVGGAEGQKRYGEQGAAGGGCRAEQAEQDDPSSPGQPRGPCGDGAYGPFTGGTGRTSPDLGWRDVIDPLRYLLGPVVKIGFQTAAGSVRVARRPTGSAGSGWRGGMRQRGLGHRPSLRTSAHQNRRSITTAFWEIFQHHLERLFDIALSKD